MNTPPSHASVVIIGGGIVGASTAYHLAQRGVEGVVLLERNRFTSGTTWHAAGLVGQLRATENLTRLSRYSLDLYARLEAETGQATGLRQPGAISLATTSARFEELSRTAAMASALGIEANVISAADVAEMWPALETRDVVGAVHLPHDGMVSPVDTTNALLEGARRGGVQTLQRSPVTGLLIERGVIAGVETAAGPIRAEQVVLAAGLWSRDFAARYGVAVPLHAAEHYYAITQPIPGLEPTTPIVRDPDHCAYFKEDAGHLLIGLFEQTARPWPAGAVPEDPFIELSAELDHVTPLLDRAMQRLPSLRDVELRQIFCGPEAFTPDDQFILGEAPGLPGLFVAAGFNSIGIQAAGGVGDVLAAWLVERQPPLDLWEVDIRRFEPFQANRRYLRERTVETLGLLYQMHWPNRQPETARGVRRSPLHDALTARGACFGELAGWERPNWFGEAGESPEQEYSYGRANGFERTAAEHRATREAVGLYDQSSYGKLVLRGPEAEAVLQRISAADLAVEPGRIVYTPWLNEAGGIEADLTVTRTAEDEFWIVTTPATRVRDRTHLERALQGANATLVDCTSGLATLGVMGPQARELLARLSDADWSNEAFPFATSQQVEIGHAPVRALRVTYVGELGYELYVPTEFTAHLFEALLREGDALGLRLCGFHAMASCRLEKGYRHWGHDIGPSETPLEAGLGFTVAWAKDTDFVGRSALEAQRETGVRKRVVQFLVRDPAVMLHHDEPILRDGVGVGLVTSGAWGHTLDGAAALGLVHHPEGLANAAWVREGRWEIVIAGRRFDAQASLQPLYDPRGERVRA